MGFVCKAVSQGSAFVGLCLMRHTEIPLPSELKFLNQIYSKLASVLSAAHFMRLKHVSSSDMDVRDSRDSMN